MLIKRAAPAGGGLELRLDGPGERYLQICDTGVGTRSHLRDAAVSADGNHVGIEIMHERMTALGGRLEFVAGADCGVSVKAVLPEVARR